MFMLIITVAGRIVMLNVHITMKVGQWKVLLYNSCISEHETKFFKSSATET